MEKKIDIAAILKDCPRGMELDSPMFEGLEFDSIVNDDYFSIRCRIKHPDGGYNYNFTKYGCWTDATFSKCVIFPKGKTTWEDFTPPCEFKDGDILYVDTDNKRDDNSYKYVFIFKEMIRHTKEGIVKNKVISHCYFSDDYLSLHEKYLLDDIYPIRFATEEEKQKLFDAIRANGYRWDAETKTLEKLKPKFKIGNKIRYKNGKNINGIEQGVILSITNGTYDVAVTNNIGVFVPIEEQDDWEVIPHKFDIHTLKPFESKVLVRDDEYSLWQPSLWGLYDKGHRFPYVTVGCRYRQCIPYKGNEYLLGKDEMCDDYYKTW